jgi:hypothetical protein
MIFRHEDEYIRAGVSMAEFRGRIGPNFWRPTARTPVLGLRETYGTGIPVARLARIAQI